MALQLYYDNYRGLVKSTNGAVGQSIIEHDQKGWDAPLHEQILEIPSRNVKVVVRTNFGWGPRSYMNARISMMDKSVFNFIDTRLGHSIKMIYANPGDWNMLFDSIIYLYNGIYNCENSIITYFDAIEEAINGSSSVNKRSDAIARLAEISDNLSDSIYADNIFIDKRMKRACKLLVGHIVENWNKVQFNNEEHRKIEANLQSIFGFFSGRKEILDMFIGNTHNCLTKEL